MGADAAPGKFRITHIAVDNEIVLRGLVQRLIHYKTHAEAFGCCPVLTLRAFRVGSRIPAPSNAIYRPVRGKDILRGRIAEKFFEQWIFDFEAGDFVALYSLRRL